MEFEIEGLREGLSQKAVELVQLRKEVVIKDSTDYFTGFQTIFASVVLELC
jgi:hypothetical protein